MSEVKLIDKLTEPIVSLSNKIMINRKHKVSFNQFFKALYLELKKNDLVSESQAVAFSFTLAIFPGIIFLFTLVPFIPIENLDLKIYNLLQENIPAKYFEEAKQAIETIIQEMVVRQRGGLLSFGFLMSAFTATSGMMGLMSSFNKCYKTVEKRSFIKTRLIATSLTFMFATVLFSSFVFIIFSKDLTHWLAEIHVVQLIVLETIQLIEKFLLPVIFYIMMATIYFFAPAVNHKWNFFSLGAGVATTLFFVSSAIFSFYINNFASYNKLYGSIGTLIGIMLWLQIVAYVIMLGFEINVALDKSREKNLKKSQE